MKRLTTILMMAVVLTGCNRQNTANEPTEDQKAKALLQGVWVDEESGDLSFRAKGDTIFFADTTSMPSSFRIIGDSLVLGSNTKYGIVKQAAHIFWFKNQNGDIVKLVKSDDEDIEKEFVHDQPKILTYTHQVKTDSVVMHNGNRYHWYIAVNPTKYKVSKRSYNDDGIEVENVYYDNIMHVSVFLGAQRLFSSDFKKQMFNGKVPANFLNEAILGNMAFSHIDDAGLHFDATICIPDGASCYMVEIIISFSGQMSMKTIEY